jgi:hypothetical protein
MTTRDERTRALLYAHDFLTALISGHYNPVPKEVHEHARRVLRHFPTPAELLMTAEAEERACDGKCPLAYPMLSAPVLQQEVQARLERHRRLVQRDAVSLAEPSESQS